MSNETSRNSPDAHPNVGIESAIKQQYEEFPYPQRDPSEERNRLLKTILDSIPCINHFVFGGRFDFSTPLRVLIAGGGTGDSLIYLAQQLHDFDIPSEITYIDLSDAARRIAQSRAAARGLNKIRFEVGSLLNLDSLGPGKFDYINCSGVLHHLENPAEGLKALEQRLDPNGGMGLMLYAALGRTGVYPVQKMLRIIAPESYPAAERIRIARKLVASLPELNWLRRNPALTEREWQSDSDLFDLLLNSQDQAYSIEEVANLTAMTGLRITSFMPPGLFEPSTYLKDPELLECVSGLQGVARAAFAEKLIGTLNKLVFYAVKSDNPVQLPDPKDLNLIPRLEHFPDISQPNGNSIDVELKGPYFYGSAKLTAQTARIISMIDGCRSLENIRKELDIRVSDFNELFASVYPFLSEFAYIQLSSTPLRIRS